ncbi:MAG: hypothetical protein ACI4RA_08555 [Kiritimatiellia bacterium]
MNTKKTACILGGLIACCGVVALILAFLPTSPKSAKASESDQKIVVKPRKTSNTVTAKDRTRAVNVGGGKARMTREEALEDDEEARLSDEFKKLLAELRAFVEAEDWDSLLKLVRRMQASDEWPDGLPSILHEEAIDALADMGKKGLPELIGYLGCDDEDLRDDAFDAIEDMFDDDSLSDWEKNEMLRPFLRSLHDEDQLESLMDLIVGDMRNSCAVDICKFVLEHGTIEARRYLAEQVLEDLTGDEAIRTKEQLDAWLANNPDGEEDAEDYAGDKETDGDGD